MGDIVKKQVGPKYNLNKFFAEKNPEPMIFATFAGGLEGDGMYDEIEGVDKLSHLLTEGLSSYNDSNPAMDLVLFQDALMHTSRIARITKMNAGHALLVGVGGSGKQSLSKLGSFVNG